jgi:hypothetical protein
VWVDGDGVAGTNISSLAGYNVQASSATQIPFTVQAAAGQTADLQQWDHVNGTPLAKVDSTGQMYSQQSPVITANSIYAAGKNKLINGDFSVWQRGTSFTGSSMPKVFFADRWYVYFTGASGTPAFSVTRQAFTPGELNSSGQNPRHYARFACTNVGGGLSSSDIWQPIENVETLAGQVVTLSFWARSSSAVSINTRYSQVFGSGGSAENFVQLQDVAIGTTWQRYSVSFTPTSMLGKTIGDSANAFYVGFKFPASTFQIDMWGVQVEAGPSATVFQTATGTYSTELSACQRYYWRNTAAQNYSLLGTGMANSSTNVQFHLRHPVEMRTAPTSIDYNVLQSNDTVTGVAISFMAFQANETGTLNSTVNASTSGMTTYRLCKLLSSNTTAGYIGLSAEY